MRLSYTIVAIMAVTSIAASRGSNNSHNATIPSSSNSTGSEPIDSASNTTNLSLGLPYIVTSLYPDPEGPGSCATGSLPKIMQTEEGFYSHFLIEVTANALWDEGYGGLKTPNFPRGWYTKCSSWLNYRGYYTHTAVNYYHVDNTNQGRYGRGFQIRRNYDNMDSPDRVILLAFRLENYTSFHNIVIDPVFPIRAIYFPQMFQDPTYRASQPQSRMGQIKFNAHSSLNIQGENVKMDSKRGLGLMDRTLVIDVMPAMLALSIPQEKLDKTKQHPCYSYISLRQPVQETDKIRQRYGNPEFEFEDKVLMDGYGWMENHYGGPSPPQGEKHIWLDKYVSLNEQVSLVSPRQPDQSLLYSISKSIVGLALGLVPVVGPFLQFSFDTIEKIINQPEKWEEEAANLGVGKAALTMELKLVKGMLK